MVKRPYKRFVSNLLRKGYENTENKPGEFQRYVLDLGNYELDVLLIPDIDPKRDAWQLRAEWVPEVLDDPVQLDVFETGKTFDVRRFNVAHRVALKYINEEFKPKAKRQLNSKELSDLL